MLIFGYILVVLQRSVCNLKIVLEGIFKLKVSFAYYYFYLLISLVIVLLYLYISLDIL